jgi:tol-pal system protein YbgF
MKRVAAVLLLALAAAGCQSTTKGQDLSGEIYPPPAPVQTAAADARVGELQTSMTELLERIDVLNDRMSRLENAAANAAPVAASPAPRAIVEQPLPAPASAASAEPMPAPQPVASGASMSQPLLGARIAESYRGALELYGKSKLADARKAFQQVFDVDPAGELADNALYWIGETYFAQANYGEAMRYYQRVTKEYADQNKAPDALFKIGVTQEKTGDLALARQAFEECIKRYPYAGAAASAKLELKRIKY